MTPEEFTSAWQSLVLRWRDATPGTADARAVLDEALRHGLAATVSSSGPDDRRPTAKEDLQCQTALVRISDAFDAQGYDRANRLRGRVDAARHFCASGWRDFHNPSLEFDLWWYRFSVLGLDVDDVNPFVHYLLVGRHEGLPGLPPPVPLTDHIAPPGVQEVKRVFLFAGYDVDRIVDPYVVRFVRELSRHGDVFYLADNPLAESELDKIRPFTQECWAIHHTRYDFGSYAMLASELVGWDRLDQYDEVVLVNDSCYLLKPLDDLFSTMDETACDWWGLQASKRDFDRAHGHRTPLPMSRAKVELVGSPEWHQLLFLHVSSYLVGLRRPAFTDPGFRELVDQVTTQRRKDDIIFKYELGLSRQLLSAGHDLATFIPDLYPFHPVYTEDHFELIARGFPFLKRSFITENTERAADLVRWRERVLELVPDAPVDEIADNLRRVGAHDSMQASFAVTSDGSRATRRPDVRRMSVDRLRREDRQAPKHDHWWAFVTDSRTHHLSSDAAALFAEVSGDPSIKKVVLTRSRDLAFAGANVEVRPLSSPDGLELLLRCRQVVASGEPRVEVPYALSFQAHNFVHPGHAHPLRAFGAELGPEALETALEKRNRIRYRGVVTASRTTALAVAGGLHPSPVNAMWPLGCPRHDLIVSDTEALPDEQRRQREAAAELIGQRRAVIWTWSTADRRDHPYTDAELETIDDWCARTGTVILTREALEDRRRRHADALMSTGAIELTSREFPHVEVVFPLTAAMITDDSPHLVDYLLTGRPAILWPAPTSTVSTAWVVDPHVLLPGPICTSLDDVLDAVDRSPSSRGRSDGLDDELRRKLLVEHDDDRNAWRVAQHLRNLRTEDVDYDALMLKRRDRERRERRRLLEL